MPKTHTIQAGQSVESVAYDNGLFWQTVWDLPENAALRDLRGEPNILEEGDVLVIPDKRPKQEPADTGRRHTFLRKGVPATLSVRLVDQDGPRAGVGYTLTFGDRRIEGVTDGEGWIRCYLMPDVTTGLLEVGPGETYPIEIGTVRPASGLQGIQNRLRNLGHYRGPVDGEMTPELESAIEQFQAAQDLPVTGELNAQTRDALLGVHGS